uniref:polynucleotide adenylyltransferase n=1 Tax=Percolomonas cosmopolitus TaxID=63605 RepID=A0A7S1KNA3_9EUKA|mmetsp:Transcript_2574/g.9827  ORF Transcript_2574/g.9827 Transcript_2574/m.9827 type:complete len:690 (+) Transcript_2574:646-2715(+)
MTTPMDISSLSAMDVSMNDVRVDDENDSSNGVQHAQTTQDISSTTSNTTTPHTDSNHLTSHSSNGVRSFNAETTFLQNYLVNKTYTHYSPSIANKYKHIASSPGRDHLAFSNNGGGTLPTTNPSTTTNEYASISTLPELQAYRQKVLRNLETVIINYLKENVTQLQSYSRDECCKMLTFGSCRLGVDSWNSDIDLVAVVPRCVTREIFFEKLRHHLKENSHVACMNAVTDAYVPVLKFIFHGVPIDLLYAAINVDKIVDDFDILDEELLYNVDEATQRALNGPRVADQILTLVPSEEKFRLTLQCVKFWAKRRGIYSNSFGYLGGIAWALLVANTCRLYPNDAPNVLLQRFFHIYRYWKWPSPVILKDIEDGVLGFRVWNPKKFPSDRVHLMPIITPAYPSMNSSFNVSRTTMRLIIEEFVRADSILNNSQTVGQPFTTEELDELFEENNFFIRYKDYLQLEVTANTHDEHRVWEAFIESRLRFLVYSLEQVDTILVHPFPHSFPNPVYQEEGKTSSLFYIGLKYLKSTVQPPSHPGEPPEQKRKYRVDLTPAAQMFEYKLREWDKKTPGMLVPIISPVKRSQIPEFVCSTEKRRFFMRQRSMQRKRKLDERTGAPFHNPSPWKRAKQEASEPNGVNTANTESGSNLETKFDETPTSKSTTVPPPVVTRVSGDVDRSSENSPMLLETPT